MRIAYFSWLRAKTGTASEQIDLPQNCNTVSELIDYLSGRHPALAEIATAQGSLRYTVNRRYVEKSHPLAATDEVVLFPPVTGG
ncbi:molybdopterin converting factor subunit 1 [Nitrospirillum sp. BR 11752]|uniref:molybdopterin converting factor subunit 1 n=1 Tax=Nitrospirillum sp. BR 11752 TaxID=3104293 RepID=UPI002EB8EC55|nr:molybdopterin converting factor subunit 1 [Nitrospirillum sp. BR 11752]